MELGYGRTWEFCVGQRRHARARVHIDAQLIALIRKYRRSHSGMQLHNQPMSRWLPQMLTHPWRFGARRGEKLCIYMESIRRSASERRPHAVKHRYTASQRASKITSGKQRTDMPASEHGCRADILSEMGKLMSRNAAQSSVLSSTQMPWVWQSRPTTLGSKVLKDRINQIQPVTKLPFSNIY